MLRAGARSGLCVAPLQLPRGRGPTSWFLFFLVLRQDSLPRDWPPPRLAAARRGAGVCTSEVLRAHSRILQVLSTQTPSSVWNARGGKGRRQLPADPSWGSGVALPRPPCSFWQGLWAVKPPPLRDVCTLTGVRDGPAGVGLSGSWMYRTFSL